MNKTVTQVRDFSRMYSVLIFSFGILAVPGYLLSRWIIYSVIVLPVLFYQLNGLHRGALLSMLYIPVFMVTSQIVLLDNANPIVQNELKLIFIVLLTNGILGFFYRTQIERNQKKLVRQIYYDNLTGLPNRQKLIQDLHKSAIPVLFLINIDDFKEINDVFSPKAGDTILYELSRLISGVIEKEQCRFYKLTADEYALLFDNAKNARSRHTLSLLAEKIGEHISAATFSLDSSKIRLRVTLGIGDSRISTGDNILAQADMALKTAKAGHKPFLFYTQTIDTRENYQTNIHSLQVLTEALENDRIVPYFMPISNCTTGRIESYECLARLIDAEGRVFPPYFFLEIAKKARLYSRITRMIFCKAVDYFKDLPYQFTVNISMDDIDDPETVSTFLEVLEENPGVKNRLIFEILESESINNYPQVTTFIQLVKTYGCRIAIDDFGSGYSNFEYIPRLNVDYIKINGALIRNMTVSQENRFIVENIRNFASGLGIQTIAEYVEDETILKELKDIKVDYLQGYLIGEPADSIR